MRALAGDARNEAKSRSRQLGPGGRVHSPGMAQADCDIHEALGVSEGQLD